MNVLVVSHMYPSSFNKVTGIFVHQQIKEMVKQGCEVKVISPVPWTPFPIKYLSNKWKRYSEVPKKLILDGIEVYYPRYLSFPKALFFASSGKRMYKGIKRLVKNIRKNFNFDIIHAHVALPDGWAGMKISEQYNKPLIVTIHGQDFQKTIFKNEACGKNIELVLNNSEKVIVVSNKLKRLALDNLNIKSKKIVVIPNGINLEDISLEKSNIFTEYRDKKVILSVSHLIRTKGIDYNLKVIAKLKSKFKDLLYLVIGEGTEKANLVKLSEKLGLTDIVKFLGQLNHNDVMRYMNICNIFSLPSWEEGFGVVYLEAMAHGKPVIACKGQGIEDVIKNKETGLLVNPQDENDLARAIDYLLLNPEQARKIGERAKQIVLENYTWEKNVIKTIEVYKEVLREK